MSQFDAKMIKANEQDVKVQPHEKMNYCEPIALQNVLFSHDHLPLNYIYKMMVI